MIDNPEWSRIHQEAINRLFAEVDLIVARCRAINAMMARMDEGY